ncbi:MAG: extracellular solute-binding protein [Spirochaetia bacterium]|jgi:iron(III) transport system substrate-binding protein|nr:extracellular solute-binding protein [Spirochaetia bacterium]
MKNLARITLLATLLTTATLPIFANGNSEAPAKQQPAAKQQQAPMSHDELVAEAQKEGKVVVYSITSRIANAAEGFKEKYGIDVEATDLKDYELIEKVAKEQSIGAQGADFVIAQDGGRVMGELINLGYLYSYMPESMKSVIPQNYQDPLVFAMINKLFIFNNEDSTTEPFDNIWALTTDEWKGKFQFKNPFQESVNANFLTTITKPEIADQIAKAYKDYFGKDITLTTKNAGYEWIKDLYSNDLVVTTSDTKTAESIGVKGQHKAQNAGLFVYSKLRYVKSKDLALQPMLNVEPFCGFIYPIYALMCSNAKHPAAAKLFIEYLLTEEGFKPWSSDIGTYSSNPNIKINEGDHPVSFWEKKLVMEDPTYCFENRADVEEFLNEYIY